MSDETERRGDARSVETRLREELAASEDRFHAIVECNAEGVLVLDGDGLICFLNPAAEELLGKPALHLLGQPFGVPHAPGEVTEIDLVGHGGLPRVAEMRVVDTTWRGQPAYLAMLRDVTARRQFEYRAREEARMRDQFLAMLAHELRNPLAAIVNAARVLHSEAANGQTQNEARRVVDRQCNQMSRLLDDLLDVSRVCQGTITLAKRPIDLIAAITDAMHVARRWAQERHQRLDLELNGESLEMEGDLERLHQVIVNLLSNATKYTPEGGRITVVAHRQGDELVVRVRDSGVGIPHEMLSQMFEPFVQGPHPLDRSQAGLGIGLCLVRTIVDLHQGTVRATSAGPNLGSEFIVRLPARVVAPAIAPAAPPVEVARAKAPQPLRILIVEDNGDVREMLTALLELDGHCVASAADGRAGFEQITNWRPDVALVDIGLPELDGYQVASRTRAAKVDDVLLVALTGYGQPEDRRQALASGFDEHLVKPVDLKKLHRVLATAPRPQPQKSRTLCATSA